MSSGRLVSIRPTAGPLSSASAAAPCWKRLLNDWYDGQIEKTYEIPCYQQAISHLPDDVETYSSARDDIAHARELAIAAQNESPPTTTAPVVTETGSVSPTTTAPTTTAPPTTTTTTTPPTTGRDPGKGIPRAIDKITPGNADTFPLPLIILGVLALLLVAAGVGGIVWRRFQGGRPGTP
jgi:cobalamin biosynthesis Mg chelatase CobN